MKSGIYTIFNTVTGKRYIGSAVNIQQRWRQHRFLLKQNDHFSSHLQASWNKYGEDSFRFEILEEVSHKTKLLKREQFWLDHYKSYLPEIGYNTRQKAASNLGCKLSEASKQKMRKPKSLEARLHMKQPKTLEHRQRLREAKLGTKQTLEHRQAIGNALKVAKLGHKASSYERLRLTLVWKRRKLLKSLVPTFGVN